jgi:spermidine synthase
MAEIFGGCLDDPRVAIQVTDVGQMIRSEPAAWDAILLDVDNGPEGIVHKSNDALYSLQGIGAARNALKPGGVLAVWSQGPDSGFTRRLKQAGFTVEEVSTRANGKRGARHVIWIAANGSQS